MVFIPSPANIPTDLVTFTVKTDGQAINTTWRVLQVEVNREVNRIPSARLVIADGDVAAQDFAASSSADFIPGKTIEISAGYHSSETTIFKGVIVKHSIKANKNNSSVLVLDCRDEIYKMSIGRKNSTFDANSDSDILNAIFNSYGANATVEPTSDIHEKIVQYNITDWDFVNMRAEMNSLFVFVDDGRVEVKKLNPAQQAVMILGYGSTILSFEAEIDSRNQFKGVKSQSWDSASQAVVEKDGSYSAGNQPGNLANDDLANIAGLDFLMLRHSGQITDKELKSWSDAMLNMSRMSKNCGRLAIEGIAEMKPGLVVELQGLGDRFNGNALVTAVRHEIADGTWVTHLVYGLKFETFAQHFRQNLQEMPASGLISPVHGLQAGVVTALENDPKGEFRIKVKLPVINPNEAGLWARVAKPDAGNNRGFEFLPEVGDEVIVGFMNDDPRNPVILGTLHSSALPSPNTFSDSNHQKALVTRSGMKISFDDEKKIVEVSTPGGYLFHLDEDRQEVLLQDAGNNKILMKSDGITLESPGNITLKATGDLVFEGMNVTQKASAQMKIEGMSGMEAKSSGITVIKGSMVQIN